MDRGLMEKMARKRVLLISGEITSQDLGDIRLKLINLCEDSSEPVLIIIDSIGGDLEEVWGFCDTIPMLSNTVIGLVIGKCYSSAFVILQACDIRLATPNSIFRPHHLIAFMSYSMYKPDGNVIDNMSRALIEARRSQKRIEDIIMNRSGQRRSVIKKFFILSDALEARLDVDEVLGAGFIDGRIRSMSELKSKIKSAKKFSKHRK